MRQLQMSCRTKATGDIEPFVLRRPGDDRAAENTMPKPDTRRVSRQRIGLSQLSKTGNAAGTPPSLLLGKHRERPAQPSPPRSTKWAPFRREPKFVKEPCGFVLGAQKQPVFYLSQSAAGRTMRLFYPECCDLVGSTADPAPTAFVQENNMLYAARRVAGQLGH